MRDFVFDTVVSFLKQYSDSSLPTLLAFSGGPDSLAMLHNLLQYRERNPEFAFALAHVDHGWRVESGCEADLIKGMAKDFNVPIHIKQLNPDEMKGNLESVCREARLQFFAELCAECGYQAVILGHHADDLAETVLKRTLEGASLSRLGGMQPEVVMDKMKLWRPFLSVKKQQLLSWLEEHGLKGFEDPTNEDPRFLRARFRTRILPALASEFGKEITTVLCRLGHESHELRHYLDGKVSRYLDRIIESPFGVLLDLSNDCPSAELEVKHLIRSFCEKTSFAISREGLDSATKIFMNGGVDKRIEQGGKCLCIDRHRLFIAGVTLRVEREYSI